jgi:hypothetical protein
MERHARIAGLRHKDEGEGRAEEANRSDRHAVQSDSPLIDVGRHVKLPLGIVNELAPTEDFPTLGVTRLVTRPLRLETWFHRQIS